MTQFPLFDPTRCMRDNDGREVRFVHDPLDRTYLENPSDLIPAGMLPPEDMEVREAATALALIKLEAGYMGVFARLFTHPSELREKRRRIADAEDRLRRVATRSPEHQAAVCRIVDAMPPNANMRQALENLVTNNGSGANALR